VTKKINLIADSLIPGANKRKRSQDQKNVKRKKFDKPMPKTGVNGRPQKDGNNNKHVNTKDGKRQFDKSKAEGHKKQKREDMTPMQRILDKKKKKQKEKARKTKKGKGKKLK